MSNARWQMPEDEEKMWPRLQEISMQWPDEPTVLLTSVDSSSERGEQTRRKQPRHKVHPGGCFSKNLRWSSHAARNCHGDIGLSNNIAFRGAQSFDGRNSPQRVQNYDVLKIKFI